MTALTLRMQLSFAIGNRPGELMQRAQFPWRFVAEEHEQSCENQPVIVLEVASRQGEHCVKMRRVSAGKFYCSMHRKDRVRQSLDRDTRRGVASRFHLVGRLKWLRDRSRENRFTSTADRSFDSSGSLYKTLVPEFEHQQRPKGFAMICDSAFVLVEQFGDIFRVENSGASHSLW